MTAPVFALVDVNNFYASCEQLFEPRLRGRPVVVLSNNDGCVVARSKEAKLLGVPMGAPWHHLKALAQQHSIVAVSSNYALYADMSNRVVEVLSGFCSDLEVYSIDESFLNLGGYQKMNRENLAGYGQAIRQRVAQWVGLPVCVGMAETKTLAKLANHLAKKNTCFEGVCNFAALSVAERESWMSKTEVGEVWGVGRRISKKLEEIGIKTVSDLREADLELVRRSFSVVMQRTVQELRGISCLHLAQVVPDKQQIMSSRSFGRPVYSLQELSEAVSSYVCRAAEKLRSQRSVAGGLLVSIRTNPFKESVEQYSRSLVISLPEPTADSRALCDAALRMLKAIYRPGIEYKKAAVMLSQLQPEGVRQQSLFDMSTGDIDRERAGRLMKALDDVNSRYGRGTVTIGSSGLHAAWMMQRQRVMPQYTTSWSGVPVALAN